MQTYKTDSNRIGFLLTTTPWSDRRQLYRQAPSLSAGGNEIVYISKIPDTVEEGGFNFVRLSAQECRMSRATGALNLYRKIMNLDLDALQLCSVEQLPLGIALKLRSRRIRIVYDCREDMPQAMLAHKEGVGRLRRYFLYVTTVVLEAVAGRLFDGIVTSDPAVHAKYKAMPPSRKMIFFNTAPLRHFQKDYQPLEERKYDLVLMGSMSPRTGLLDVIDAVGILKKKNIHARTLLLGQPEPSVMDALESKIQSLDIADRIHISGKVDHKEVPALLKEAKIGLVPLPDFGKFKRNIACKAFEYMACGMPCICTDIAPQRLFVREGHNGLFYKPGSAKELAERIEGLLVNPEVASEMGRIGREDVEKHWNAELFEEKYRNLYADILSGQPRGLPIGRPSL